jgi:hypothetical protein
MSIQFLGWIFILGVLIHNAEEALFLPAWSAHAGRWRITVYASSFRFTVTVLSIAVVAAGWLASTCGFRSIGAYFLTGYALAMVLNVFIPHIAATVALRVYAPGTATALLLNLPLGSWFVYRSLVEGYVNPSVFVYSGPATVMAITASVPLLYSIGKRLTH